MASIYERCKLASQNENATEYFFEKLRLCKALNFGLDEIKTQIAIGLWSKSISSAVMCRSYFDDDELLRHIQTIEQTEEERRKRINASKPETSSTPVNNWRKSSWHKDFSSPRNGAEKQSSDHQ